MRLVNKPKHYCRSFRTALIVLTLPVLPTLAQEGFKVSTETGLEMNSALPKPAAAVKNPKPADVAEKKATEITSIGETTFDAKGGMAIFIKDVKVNDPQFSLTADKLTVYLKKEKKQPVASGTSEPVTPPTPAGKLDALASPASGLERAVAEGNVIITQDKVDEKTGDVTRYVGKGAKADYNAVTGEMVLSGWPQIQQGLNNQVATEEGTVMIMDKDGHFRTKGPSKVVIESDTKPSKSPEKRESVKPEILKKP